jgi:eukaryotic-like serine/threonine-protein kinase
LFRTALEHGDHDLPKRRALRLELGAALANAGRGPEAAAAFLSAAEGADPDTRFRCRREAALHLLGSGRYDEGLAALTRLMDEIGERLPSTTAERVLALARARAELRLRGLRWTDGRAGSSTRDRELSDVYNAVALGLGPIEPAQGLYAGTRSLIHAFRAGDPARIGRGLAYEAIFASLQGRANHARVELLLDELRKLEHKDARLEFWHRGARALHTMNSGAFREAAHLLGEVERLGAEQPGFAWELNSIRLMRVMSLMLAGSFQEMSAELDRYLVDAKRRDDVFAATSMTRACFLRWLVDDDPDRALSELDASRWSRTEGLFHHAHWHVLMSRAAITLYRSDRSELPRLREEHRAAERSLFIRSVELAHVQLLTSEGRLALLARDLDRAAWCAKRLEQKATPFGEVYASLISAGVFASQHKTEDADRALTKTIDLATRQGLAGELFAAKRRRGELLGGPRGATWMKEADDAVSADGVATPERLADYYAPGFRREK